MGKSGDQNIGGTGDQGNSGKDTCRSRNQKNSEKDNNKSRYQREPIARLEKLWVWQKAHQLMFEVHKICQTLPKQERFKVRGQKLYYRRNGM